MARGQHRHRGGTRRRGTAPQPGRNGARPAVQEQVQADGTRVLLADDHPANRLLLQRQLGVLGYAAEACANGREALHRWRAGRFGLVVADCHMPEMDGYEFVRAVRHEEAAAGRRRTPIIAWTASDKSADVARCLEAGFDDCVAKPAEPSALRKKLQQWLPLPAPAAPSREMPSPDPEPVDRAALADITGGDAALARELVTEFRRACPADAERLIHAVAAGDLVEASDLSHRIGGASRVVGATRLADLCRRLEAAGRRNDRKTLEEGLPALCHELELVDDDLAAF